MLPKPRKAAVSNIEQNNTLALEGEWDLARRDELQALCALLSSERPATIDIRGLTYADSTVLSALATLAVRFNGATITLLGPTPQIKRLLLMVNFDKLFRIVEEL